MEDFWWSHVIIVFVFSFCFAFYLSQYPTSYPGGPRKKKSCRSGKWNTTKDVHFQSQHWKCATNDNQVYDKQGVITGEKCGRQVWAFSNSKASLNKLAFDANKNPNAGDKVYRSQCIEQENPVLGKGAHTARQAARDGIKFYEQLQTESGHWPGDYGGPMFLMPGLVMMAYITKVELPAEMKNGMVCYLKNHQQIDGGWGIHIASPSTLFGTIMSYVTLRLLGQDANLEYMLLAKRFFLNHGGAIRVPSWGKFWLACAGLYDWKGCNSVPPELWLLPRWFPFHPGKLWCHCRMVYLPMSYLYGVRFVPTITKLLADIRSELYEMPYESICWTKARTAKVAEIDEYSAPTLVMRMLTYVLSIYEKCPIKFLRQKGLAFAAEYLHVEDVQTNYICIGPVNKTLNMLCAYHIDSTGKELSLHIPRLYDYVWVAEDGVKMQGYNGSQMWDTSFAAQAILDTGLVHEFQPCLRKAQHFMNVTQIRDNEVDHEKWFRHVSKGGWPFSTSAHGWPISDCTAEGLKATLRLQNHPDIDIPERDTIEASRFYDAINVIQTLQNADGGWATYENNRGFGWFEWLNPSEVFGDIMIDYSYVECTSACICAIQTFRKYYPNHLPTELQLAVQRGAQFIQSIQRPDGSWYGSWGVCFTYGTWFGIEGLVTAGLSPNHPSIQKACAFLLSKQRPDGGWSESYLSCVDKSYTEHKDGSQIVQTAWAILGLLRGQCQNLAAIDDGIQYLLSKQLSNGDWDQEGVTGVFNRNCGITYTSYRNVFPIWALGLYASKK